MPVDTIQFDVGGKLFKVSRALIDGHQDTMLGKLVSDAWQEDSTETVFIDRNGDMFALILEYLRYGRQCLIAKSITYYGIHSFEGTINQESIAQVADCFRHAKSKHDMFFLAVEANYQYAMNKTNSSKYVHVRIHSNHKLYRANTLSTDEIELLKTYLTTYFGLRLNNDNVRLPTRDPGGHFCVLRSDLK
ncbi:hypothetical protein ACHAWF_008740 [Thalassiosira exigua]